MTLVDLLVLLRSTIGYPAMVTAGLVLGTIALGRMRSMVNGRRRLYRALTAVAFGLAWSGLWGVLGVWQYGQFTVPLPVAMPLVSAAFSVGVIWIGLGLLAVAVIVLVDEYSRQRVRGGNRGVQ